MLSTSDYLDEEELWTAMFADESLPASHPSPPHLAHRLASDACKDEDPSLWLQVMQVADLGASSSPFPPHPASDSMFTGPLTLPMHPSGGSLSKPAIRHDGLLVVGSEASPNDSFATEHGLFLSNFRSPDNGFVPLRHAVRDLQWVEPHAIVLAVGKDLQVLRVGTTAAECHLEAPITMTHSNLIRELAVCPAHPRQVLSGGFDETVCMTDLDRADVVLKFDARDVVSSLRWIPDGTAHRVSWTTDGGAFSMADIRVKSASGQLNVASPSLFRFEVTGGLYAHEYVSEHDVVLAYEKGHLAFLDIRKLPAHNACHLMVHSPLCTVGEVRKSLCGDVALFGLGGFAIADLSRASCSTRCAFEFYPVFMDPTRKTSGDFAIDNVTLLAVSDSAGLVSVYDMQTLRGVDDTFAL
ncbi:hypothetical protein SPRG_04583 [Saprolegnia parasitica CBS 223.65]|uniref:Anaphase-promoting complex subunit 4 WD40 domain-containing protein n=1 Tax=Saprolegnia parasitica (strain CBS 223.65) TaxID=695850 RepID=A0A067CV98_SAPPC|nr:hypothetical protein SPRG_04583 [Saprolegnia parasitica CBS 223.65]KDO30682.1 hypothetical protein SPRG_04583 [Saprolegnia parasitica CBS 223.65]|eukprot:XP_012198386.1 hypothetical protein SPRG_04583 [Saprolegnia parasitica CBS 223.65]